jgi:hypothetical protein
VYNGSQEDYKFVRQYAPKLGKYTSDDEFGRLSTVWYNTESGPAQVDYASSSNLVASYENKVVKFEDIEDDLDLLAGNEGKFAIYKDGSEISSSAYEEVSGDTEFGGRGSVVEVYNDTTTSKYQYRIVVINTYVAVVGDIKPDDTTVTLTYVNGYTAQNKATTATVRAAVADLAKGDVVSFNVGKVAKKVGAYNVTKLTGTAITTSGFGTTTPPVREDYVIIGGEKVFKSNYITAAAKAGIAVTAYTDITSGTFYYDSYGNVLYYANVSDDPLKTVDGYLYTLTVETYAGTNTNTLLDNDAAQAKAKVLDVTTGKVSTITLAVGFDEDNESGNWVYLNAAGKYSEDVVYSDDPDENTFYGYYVLDDGTYVLEEVDGTDVVSLAGGDEGLASSSTILKKGQAKFAGKYTTASTKLTILTPVVEKKTYSISTVTGLSNFPEVKSQSSTTTKALVISKDNKISQIIVLAPDTTSETPADSYTYGYVKAQGATHVDEATGDVTVDFEVQVGDEVKTYTVSYAAAQSISENTVYQIEESPKLTFTPVADLYDSSTNKTAKAVVSYVGDGYIVVGPTTGKEGQTTPAANTVIDLDANCTTLLATPQVHDLQVGSTIQVYYSNVEGNDNAVFIVVTADPVAEEDDG